MICKKVKSLLYKDTLLNRRGLYPKATGDFTGLMWDLDPCCKTISREVNKAGLADILGLTGEKNIHGDVVKKLDIYANERICKAMDHGGHLCIMASEENEDVIPIPDEFPRGKYVLLFDPLDGSSNIDVNVSVGTIFSIHKRKTTGKEATIEDCLRKGTEQVAAGYIVYGSSTMMVYTTGQGVHGFTLDPSIGEFLLSHENIKIPSKGKIYSINEGNANTWDEGTKKYIAYLKENDPATGRPFSLRYIGSLVADFHRNLLYGGIFLYPADYKDPKNQRRNCDYFMKQHLLPSSLNRLAVWHPQVRNALWTSRQQNSTRKCRSSSAVKKTY